jgi:hypothetical protein
MKNIFCGLTILAAMLIAAPTHASIIDTTTTWNGSDAVAPFGEPDRATYGQTFSVGSDNTLDSFAFWLDDLNGPVFSVNFATYVMAWDGTKATGPVLYSSSMTTTTNNGGQDGMERLDFSTGGLSLTSGDTYVAFMSASNFFNMEPGTAAAGFLDADVYADGEFVFLNNGDDSSEWTTEDWETSVVPGGDLAFVANFSNDNNSGAVPEPTSMLIWGAGIGLALTVRRRNRRA